MELGYSISTLHGFDVTPAEAAAETVRRAELASDAGFDYIQTGDHHVERNGHYLQNVPTVSRLSAYYDHAATLFLLPLYDPILVAEQAGTVASFVDRFDLWCSIGRRQHEFDAFDVDKRERVPRLIESVEAIRAIWNGEGVSYDGEFYSFEDVDSSPKAPDARICIGGGVEAAVRRAGRIGDAWVAHPRESNDDVVEKSAWFEEAGGGDLIVRRDALVLEDGNKAHELVDDAFSGGYRGWAEEEKEVILTGDSEEVAAELEALTELGVDEVVVRPMFDEFADETLQNVASAHEQL